MSDKEFRTRSGHIARVTSNWVPREVLPYYAVPMSLFTPGGRFDYRDTYDKRVGSIGFVRYLGEWFDLGDAEPSYIEGWDGVWSDSHSTATVFRWALDENGNVDDERVILGAAQFI